MNRQGRSRPTLVGGTRSDVNKAVVGSRPGRGRYYERGRGRQTINGKSGKQYVFNRFIS